MRVAGYDAYADTVVVRRLIGVVAHQTYLDDELTALENLRFYGALYDVPDVTEGATVLLDAVGLASKRDARAGSLSRGQQRAAHGRPRALRPSANSLSSTNRTPALTWRH